MRANWILLSAIGVLFLPSAQSADFPCDRACLNGFTPFDQNCTRIENGVVTSNNPAGNAIAKMSCGDQFATGFSANKITVWNDGTTHPVNTPFDEPFSFEIGELFKIKDGKIAQIEALVLNVPYGMRTGW